MGWGWRYSIGMLSWLQYTLLPGRLFGGDHYNPYSNTISLYSDYRTGRGRMKSVFLNTIGTRIFRPLTSGRPHALIKENGVYRIKSGFEA